MDLTGLLDSAAKFAQDLLVTALPVVAAWALNVAHQWANAKIAQLRAVAAQQEDYRVKMLLEAAVNYAVEATEMVYSGMALPQEKKDYAIGVAQRFLDSRGVKVDVKVIADAIESQVFRLNDATGAKSAE